MHSALWHLLWLDFSGWIRSLLSLRRNWRQILLVVMMLSCVGLFVWARIANPNQSGATRFGPAMPFWALLYLCATWLTASADRGLVMRPAEVHFIVGGPFRDRDVITLNLIRLALRALVSAVVLSLLAMAYVPSYPSALVGMWLLIAVSLLVGMIASLSARSAHGGAIKWIRRAFNLAALAVLLLLIGQAMQFVRAQGGQPSIGSVAAAAIETPVGQKVLPPLAWLFAPLASPRFVPDTLQMLPARFGLVAGLAGMVYFLGGSYLEATARRTDLSMLKRQTAMRSGVAGMPGKRAWTARFTLPMFARTGGIGSVAWMQVLHSLRVLPRFLMFTLTVVGVVLVVPMTVDPAGLGGTRSMWWMTGLTLYADFLLLLQLPVGFLGPVAQRELLKSLPIPSWRLVFGQLAGPILPLSLVHLAVTLLFLYLEPDEWRQVLVMSLVLLPGAWVLIANINLLGAWNIIRPRALQQRDALAAGRAMASVWVFFAMLTPAIVVGTVFAVAGRSLVREDPLVMALSASLGVALSSWLYVYLLARTFRRWQPSAAAGGAEEVEHDG